MKNLINIKKQGTMVAIAAAIVSASLGLSANAYGPERQTFTAQNPADYVTFNSITNNPTVGDERNFVRIKEVGAANYVDSVDLIPGKEYEVYTYYHNNAKDSLNSKENNYRGVALDVKLKLNLPSVVEKGSKVRVLSTISASNSKPLSVWDSSAITSSQRTVALRYIQGSASIRTKGSINGQALPGEKLFGDGMLLGYSALNGALPGCDQYSGVVTYRFKADYADFNVSKTVSKNGVNNFAENQAVKPGEKVDFKITYNNTGTVYQNNVHIRDILPVGMSLVPGTTRITTPGDPAGKILNDNIISANGINIGNYSYGASATVMLTAVVDASKLVCGVNNLTNNAQVITQNGTKSDTAKVTVDRTCTPTEKQFCQIPGKTHLKKDDPACKPDDKCKVPGKQDLKPNDPKCFEPCIIKGKENLKKDDPNCNDPCPIKGKENLKANDPNCSEKCTIRGLEHLPAGDKNCAQIPSELPQTGPAEAAMMVIAVVALSGAAAYYIRSRQEFKALTAEATTKVKQSDLAEKVEEEVSKK